MAPADTPHSPMIALLVEPRLLSDLLQLELERLGATVLVDDTTSRVDVVVASPTRTEERQRDGTRWVTIPPHEPAPTVAGARGTLVEHLDELARVAMKAASG